LLHLKNTVSSAAFDLRKEVDGFGGWRIAVICFAVGSVLALVSCHRCLASLTLLLSGSEVSPFLVFSFFRVSLSENKYNRKGGREQKRKCVLEQHMIAEKGTASGLQKVKPVPFRA